MKLLLDTNILIDYLSQRDPFFTKALLLREAAIFGDVELWCSTQSFTDAEYILRDAFPTDKLRSMMEKCLVFMKACAPTASDLSSGITSGWPDLEDYLIAASAQRIKADFIITRDKEGFLRSKIPAISPERFFKLLSDEHGITYDEIDL